MKDSTPRESQMIKHRMNSKRGYFSTYQSPNIVIDPNKSAGHPAHPAHPASKEMQGRTNRMNSSLVKKKKEENLNDPIQNKHFINETNKTSVDTILMDNNICSQIKVEETGPGDDAAADVTSAITNKSCNGDNDLNCAEKDCPNNKFNSKCFTKKTELNNKFVIGTDAPKEETNSSSKLSRKFGHTEDDKNKVNRESNVASDTSQNNDKQTKDECLPKTFKEASIDRTQVNRKHRAGKNKSEPPKKIKITINITYNNIHSKENISSNRNADGDLSFLDDFDVDEVVESLFNGEDQYGASAPPETGAEGHVRDSDKKRKTQNTDHKADKTEEIKKPNIGKKESPKGVGTEIIKGDKADKNDGQIDCSHIAKSVDSESASSGRDAHREHLKDIKNELCSEVEPADRIKKHIGQGALNPFVTKCDQDLARRLEIRMSDAWKQTCSVVAVTHYGEFSKIFKCIDTSGNYYALKILDNPAANCLKGKKKENILQEVKKDIPEENLHCIYLLNSFQIDKRICCVTRYYPVNLEQLLVARKLHVREVQCLAKQLVEAVTVLRSKNIVHHDIRPSHLLLDATAATLALCGFDEAVYYNYSDNLKTNIGSVNYASPEKILGYSHSFPVDVWSTALVFYEMATNTMLFPGATHNEVLFRQMSVLGNMPENIIRQSRFKSAHFRGSTFVKKGFKQDSDVMINNFVKNNKIYAAISAAQSARGAGQAPVGREEETRSTGSKVHALARLVGHMVALDPRKRLTIEYVYADNFFFDNII